MNGNVQKLATEAAGLVRDQRTRRFTPALDGVSLRLREELQRVLRLQLESEFPLSPELLAWE